MDAARLLEMCEKAGIDPYPENDEPESVPAGADAVPSAEPAPTPLPDSPFLVTEDEQ